MTKYFVVYKYNRAIDDRDVEIISVHLDRDRAAAKILELEKALLPRINAVQEYSDFKFDWFKHNSVNRPARYSQEYFKYMERQDNEFSAKQTELYEKYQLEDFFDIVNLSLEQLEEKQFWIKEVDGD